MSNQSEGGPFAGAGYNYGRLCVGFHAPKCKSKISRLSARGIKILSFKTKTRTQYYLYTSLQ